VVEVIPDGPGEDAGISPGDRILAVDGREVGLDNDLADAIAAHEPGDVVTLTVLSSGQDERELDVRLGEHPEQTGVAYLGIRYRSIPQLEAPGGVPEGFPFQGEPGGMFPPGFRPPFGDRGAITGVHVQGVVEESPAARAGLQVGDLITAIDGQEIVNPRSLVARIQEKDPGERIRLTVQREQGERDINVTLGENPDDPSRAYLGIHLGGFFRFQEEGPSSEGNFDFQEFFERFHQDLPDFHFQHPEPGEHLPGDGDV
jgi:S1-C subfamily serine protease